MISPPHVPKLDREPNQTNESEICWFGNHILGHICAEILNIQKVFKLVNTTIIGLKKCSCSVIPHSACSQKFCKNGFVSFFLPVPQENFSNFF